MGLLDGVRVLDLSRLLPGPAATAWLVGQGAQVDRVEAPGAGDFTRHIPPFVGEVGAYYAATGHGKRSLAIDLRKPGAGELIKRILPRYDVLVEGFRPGVMEAMGLGPDTLLAAQPGLVIARLSGFGQTGPLSQRPGHDINYMGLAGALHGATRTETSIPIPTVQVADLGGALVTAAGIAAALFQRERTGKGAVLDVSLAEAALWFFAPVAVGCTADGVDPAPGTLGLAGGLPFYGTYRCADDRWITLGALEGKFQQELWGHTGGDLGQEALTALFASQPRDHWAQVLAEACVGPVLAPSELADHPHWVARGAVERVAGTTYIRPPLGVFPESGPLPGVGEHTDAVLGDAGLTPGEVDALRAAKVIA